MPGKEYSSFTPQKSRNLKNINYIGVDSIRETDYTRPSFYRVEDGRKGLGFSFTKQ